MLLAADLLSPIEAEEYRKKLRQVLSNHHDGEAFGAWTYVFSPAE